MRPSSLLQPSRVSSLSLGAGPLVLAVVSALLLVLWGPAQAQDTRPPVSTATGTGTGSATPAGPGQPAQAEARGHSDLPGAADDSAWLAMLVVSGIVAATILNRQGR